MKITQEDLLRRLKDPSNLVNRTTSISEEKKKKGNDSDNSLGAGRKPDLPNAPESLRKVASVCAAADGSCVTSAAALGLTNGQVRYAAKNEPTKLTEKKVQEVALTRLMDALGLLDADSLLNEKPKDLSIIASNLSRVHNNLRPRDERDGNSVVVQIYAPQQKKLSDYDVIEISTGTGG